MLSHNKTAFLIAAAMLPSLAFGLVPDAETETKETPAGYLSMEQARTAFGPEFGAEKNKDGTIAFLWGSTSPKCFSDAFEIKGDANRGEYTIFYKGKKQDCLDHGKQKAAATWENQMTRLSSVDELKMKLDASFDSLNLRYEDPTSDRNRVQLDPIKTKDGELISHKSAAEILEEKKKEEAKKVADTLEASMGFVTNCGHNLTELDIVDEVIRELAESKVVSSDDAKVKQLAEARKKRNAKAFAGCRLQIKRGKTDQFADCGERLKKLALDDDSYKSKVKGLYVTLLERLMNSTRLTLAEAYEASKDVIALIGEVDPKDLVDLQRKMHFHFLRLAAMEGAESENFTRIREEMFNLMLEDDLADEVFCLNENGSVRPELRIDEACKNSVAMSTDLNRYTQFAIGKQKAANDKVAAEMKRGQEQELLDRCSFSRDNKIQMGADEQYHCNLVISKRDMEAKAVANAGVSSNGFGQVVETKTPPTGTPPAQSNDQSGFNTTGYGAQNPNVTSVAPVQNPTVTPAQNVTVNRVPTLGRR